LSASSVCFEQAVEQRGLADAEKTVEPGNREEIADGDARQRPRRERRRLISQRRLTSSIGKGTSRHPRPADLCLQISTE
jgi:hypothetical protein